MILDDITHYLYKLVPTLDHAAQRSQLAHCCSFPLRSDVMIPTEIQMVITGIILLADYLCSLSIRNVWGKQNQKVNLFDPLLAWSDQHIINRLVRGHRDHPQALMALLILLKNCLHACI